MVRLGGIITAVWFAAFVAGLFLRGWMGLAANLLCGFIGLLFCIDMILGFCGAEDRRQYMRHNWQELVFLVPAFRGFRLLRAVRRSKRLMRLFAGLDTLFESADLAFRMHASRKERT